MDGIVKGYPAEFLHHPPTPQHPRNLGRLASGARLQIVDYAPAIEGKLNPKPLTDGGAPALHFTISTAMMNQHLDSWLLANDPQHGNFSMGLANIELKHGVAPDFGRDGSPSRPDQRTITVDGAKTVGQISFNNANAYTLSGSTITMDVISSR